MNMNVMLQAPAAGMDSSMMWIMLILMFVIMYFFMIRPQNKKQKEIAEFRRSLQVGQSVITAGGIHGVIKEINDNDGTRCRNDGNGQRREPYGNDHA